MKCLVAVMFLSFLSGDEDPSISKVFCTYTRISASQIQEYYKGELTDIYDFTLSKTSCDENYFSYARNNTNNDFYCYEVTSLDDSNLSLIYTINVKIQSFRKE
jgi:hypothetical protein